MFMNTCFSVSGWLTGLKEQYRPVVRPNKRTVFRTVGPVGPIKRTAPTSLRKIPHSLNFAPRAPAAGRAHYHRFIKNGVLSCNMEQTY